ncbi:MAG: DUF4328 domain-containing protein [Gordonia sp. (in: high G+C Gram-positive bacteria)]|uniref:DUF4328 domain-containing protein n=1 Tax=Gordonia sp. (in: high G+C Gram-positive bacteria) TaxID=84139 RepID=UPI0039E4AFB9
MNLDVCPRCRIKATHTGQRTVCPRCGGPLTVVDAQTRQPAPTPAPTRAPAPAPAPAPRPAASRYVRPDLRWVAHRPASTLLPRTPAKAPAPARTPSYPAIPDWGLIDQAVPPVAPADTRDAALQLWLRRLGPLVVAAAVAHALRYLLLVVNRGTPIPAWLDLLSTIAVLVLGTVVAAVALVTVSLFATWMVAVRRDSYAQVDRLDPRPRWTVAALAAVPFVSAAGAPFLLAEAAHAVGGNEAELALRRIKRVGIGWGLLNLIGLIAVIYRIVAWSGGSIQVGADALAWVTVSFVASAVFVYWVRPLLAGTVVAGVTAPAPPERRLVVTA